MTANVLGSVSFARERSCDVQRDEFNSGAARRFQTNTPFLQRSSSDNRLRQQLQSDRLQKGRPN